MTRQPDKGCCRGVAIIRFSIRWRPLSFDKSADRNGVALGIKNFSFVSKLNHVFKLKVWLFHLASKIGHSCILYQKFWPLKYRN